MSKKAAALYDDAEGMGLDGELGLSMSASPLWGALTGSAVGTLTAVGIVQFTAKDEWAELIGLAAVIAVGGALMLSKKHRGTGLAVIAVGFFNNGVRAVHQYFSAKAGAKAAAGTAVTEAAKPAATTTQGPGVAGYLPQGAGVRGIAAPFGTSIVSR